MSCDAYHIQVFEPDLVCEHPNAMQASCNTKEFDNDQQ